MKKRNILLDSIKEDIQSCFTLAELLQYFHKPVLELLDTHEDLIRKQGCTAAQIDAWKSQKNPRKEQLSEMTALVFCDKGLYFAFLEKLPPDHQKLWEVLKDPIRVSSRTLKEKYQVLVEQEPTGKTVHYWVKDVDRIRPEFRIFFLHARPVDMDNLLYLYLPGPLRQRVREFYPWPELAHLEPMKTLPTDGKQFVQSDSAIFSEWPRLVSGWRNAYFSYTVKGRPTAIAKPAKALKLREFFTDSDTRYRHLRTQLIAGLFAWADPRVIPETIVDGIVYMFREVYVKKALTAPWVLTDLKGLGIMKNQEFNRLEPGMFSMLHALPSGEWIGADRLYHASKWLIRFPYPFSQLVESFQLERAIEGTPHPYLVPLIHPENEHEWIHLSLLHGSMFLFAAFGLLELVYGSPRPGEAPPWNSLIAVRRTALGDYVVGHSAKYEPRLPEDEALPIFSEEGLLITLPDDQHRLAGLLEPYTDRVGVGKYQVGEATFLKGIKNKRELQGRIAMFRQIIGDGLPAQWTQFFTDLEGKVDPLTPVVEYQIYQIRPEDKALIQLFGKDPVLRELAVKAEGYKVLIPRNKMNDLRKRLRELGYLMT